MSVQPLMLSRPIPAPYALFKSVPYSAPVNASRLDTYPLPRYRSGQSHRYPPDVSVHTARASHPAQVPVLFSFMLMHVLPHTYVVDTVDSVYPAGQSHEWLPTGEFTHFHRLSRCSPADGPVPTAVPAIRLKGRLSSTLPYVDRHVSHVWPPRLSRPHETVLPLPLSVHEHSFTSWHAAPPLRPCVV